MIKWLLIPLLLLIGCTKHKNGFNIYTIQEGEHSSGFRVHSLRSDNLSFKCRFNSTAIYQTQDPINQLDINKLYGFSDCNDQHQENSARFGWRWLNNSIEIHAYVYNNGVRSTQYMKSVNIDETHQYSIKIDGDSYIFTIDGEIVVMNRTNNCTTGLYYKLFPYFGGDEVAPHDISIWINED